LPFGLAFPFLGLGIRFFIGLDFPLLFALDLVRPFDDGDLEIGLPFVCGDCDFACDDFFCVLCSSLDFLGDIGFDDNPAAL
jgi:hypothetical protein